jgi:hypothetical protein
MTIRRALPVGAGMEAVAVAVWLIPASVHIVRWGSDGPQRIALFASRASLVWLVIAGAMAAGLFVLLRRERIVGFAWLSLLWLWAVPFLPWLPDRVPLLLVLAGPLRWVVAAIAIGLCVRGSRLPAFAKGYGGPPKRGTREGWLGRAAVFLVSFALYLFFGALHARAIGPGGDEPHYLVITQSLLADRDLLIENNHTRREYAVFFGGPLRPDYMRRGRNGEIYSIHAPGLPALVLPAYAVGGYAGTVALLCLIGAFTALAIFDLAAALAGPRAGLIAWAAVALTVPFIPHSWLIFPELPGALIVAWAALWVWTVAGPTSDIPFTTWLWRGAALATLPWLHTKFIIFLAVFGAALFVRIWRRPKAAAAFAAPIVLSLVGWLAYFYVIYGSFNPEVPYGAYAAVNVVARNIPRGLLGLMIDQKFGLLVYSPIYVFAIAGCWMMLNRREWRWLGGVLLAAVALHVGSSTRLYMWWGGNSAPARFLVPILPCLAPMIAVAALRLRSGQALRLGSGKIWHGALLAALAVSLVIAFVGVAFPHRLLLFSDPRGKARLVELVEGSAPLTSVLPTFTQEDWRSPILNSLTLRVPPEERDAVARRGVMDLLWRYDARRHRPFDYSQLRRIDQTQMLAASTLVVDRRHFTAGPPQRLLAGPFTLPPGAYEMRISLAGDEGGEFVVSSSERAIFARREKMGNPVLVPFQLPVSVGRVMLSASTPQLANAVVRTEVVPTAVVPPGDREIAGVRAIESLPQHPGAYVVYLNEHAYPEGGVFWTRGTGDAAVVVAASGVRRLRLTVHSGPRDDEATITVVGVTRTVRTIAGQATEMTFDVPAGLQFIPITVHSSSFFRPIELDPASGDNRGLGCHVQIDLE